MTNSETVKWLINITADIGKKEHQELWHYEQALMEIREMLETEPKRIRGKWVKTDNGHVEPDAICSLCDFDWMWSDKGYFKFCPNCGADMRG